MIMMNFIIYCIPLAFALVSTVYKCEGSNVTYCDTVIDCSSLIDSVCKNHTCQCESEYYFYRQDNVTLCKSCPGLGESCGIENCCMNSDYLMCINGHCRCRLPYDGYFCWNDDGHDTARIEFLAQFILGIGLLFSLAILGSLIWRLCTRQELLQQSGLRREGSFSSLNSFQRLILARLRDRPPPYNPGFQPWKYFNSNSSGTPNQHFPSEPPPPYTISSNQISGVVSNSGTDNPVFCVEERHLQDTACALPTTSGSTKNVK